MDLAPHRRYCPLHYDAGGTISKGILVRDRPATSAFSTGESG